MEHQGFSMQCDATALTEISSHPFLPVLTGFPKKYSYERSKENGTIIERDKGG